MSLSLQVKLREVQKRQRILSHEVLMYQRVMEGMRKNLKFDSLLKLMITTVCQGLSLKRAGIFLVEPDGKTIRLAMGINPKGHFEKARSYWAISHRRGTNEQSDLVNGYHKFYLTNTLHRRNPNRRWERGLKVFANAGVPIQVGKGRVIGTLFVDNLLSIRRITRSDVTSIMNYATQVGLAIESFRTHEKILTQAITDSLTGLYNRRFFERTLAQELGRCQRYRRSCSLISVDIDHFKSVNDAYGHDAGDEILKQVSDLLRDNTRSLDVVARVGGEEFAILLPETPPQSISVVEKRILKMARMMKPSVKRMQTDGRRITVSLGGVSYRRGKVTAAQMMKLADKSLYQAKHGGRNRSGRLQVITG